jgi:hypothetical protein
METLWGEGSNVKSGFVGRPLALRRRILLVMSRFDGLTAERIAGMAYAKRMRFDYMPMRSAAQVSATRRALRRLADRGHVAHVGWQRRNKLWRLC